MNILLMGMRGSGKSTVGPLLANLLATRWGHEWATPRFVDLDLRTPGILGKKSVREAWTDCGELAFREAEVAALWQCFGDDSQVIALGGGTPTAPGALPFLSDKLAAGRARIIYLRGSTYTLQARLRKDPANLQRPSLTGKDVIAEVPTVLEQREPIYIKLADVIVSVDNRTPQETAAEVVRRMEA